MILHLTLPAGRTVAVQTPDEPLTNTHTHIITICNEPLNLHTGVFQKSVITYIGGKGNEYKQRVQQFSEVYGAFSMYHLCTTTVEVLYVVYGSFSRWLQNLSINLVGVLKVSVQYFSR